MILTLGAPHYTLTFPFSKTWLCRACFNCGSPSHFLPSCPEPRDNARVAANRVLHKAQRGEDDTEKPFRGRFFEFEVWKQQRLEWLDFFEPGSIKDPVLLEALGIQDQRHQEYLPWYDGGNAEGSGGGMLFWGYPPGWLDDQGESWHIHICQILMKAQTQGSACALEY